MFKEKKKPVKTLMAAWFGRIYKSIKYKNKRLGLNNPPVQGRRKQREIARSCTFFSALEF